MGLFVCDDVVHAMVPDWHLAAITENTKQQNKITIDKARLLLSYSISDKMHIGRCADQIGFDLLLARFA